MRRRRATTGADQTAPAKFNARQRDLEVMMRRATTLEALVIARSPFYQPVRMLARYSTRMNAVLKPIGIDVPRWRVLMLLVDGTPLTVSQLADEAVIGISTMAKIINRMAAEGLVATQTSRADARSTDVSITKAGHAVLDEARESADEVFKTALRGLSRMEIRLLNSIAFRIYENLSP